MKIFLSLAYKRKKIMILPLARNVSLLPCISSHVFVYYTLYVVLTYSVDYKYQPFLRNNNWSAFSMPLCYDPFVYVQDNSPFFELSTANSGAVQHILHTYAYIHIAQIIA